MCVCWGVLSKNFTLKMKTEIAIESSGIYISEATEIRTSNDSGIFFIYFLYVFFFFNTLLVYPICVDLHFSCGHWQFPSYTLYSFSHRKKKENPFQVLNFQKMCYCKPSFGQAFTSGTTMRTITGYYDWINLS